MKIAVMTKILPDDEDITIAEDRTLDYSMAKPVVSTYDLNAIEVAAQLAEATQSTLIAFSAGPKNVDNSKTKKNILSRGVDELHLAIDDDYDGADAYQTAQALAQLVGKCGDIDLAICGDGSADLYARQVDVQLADALGWPVVNGVTSIEVNGETATISRILETEEETVQVTLPAVVSVIPEAAQPRIAGMKDILAAGKKPVETFSAADLGGAAVSTIEVVEIKAPVPTPRKQELFDAATEGDLDRFVSALKSDL